MAAHTYEVGDTVTYEAFGGSHRTGVITGKYDDVKNGRPGFDMELPNGGTVWGYDLQIVRVRRG